MKRIAALILLACMTAKAQAAFAPFVVSDIRIDGLERISAGTVFTYLPVEKGDTLTQEQVQKAIRALFQTGFFKDIAFDRQGDILVIKVHERPAISKINLRGNKDIKSDDLLKGLKLHGHGRGPDLRPPVAGSHAAGADPPVLQPRQVQRVGGPARGQSGPQPRLDRHRDPRGQGGAHQAHQHRRQQDLHRQADPPGLRVQHQQLDVLVQQGRSVLARKAFRRPGKAVQLLPGPRLCRFQHRLHPGRDKPGQAVDVHHRRCRGRRQVQGLGRQIAGQPGTAQGQHRQDGTGPKRADTSRTR